METMEAGHRSGMVTTRMGLEDDEPVRLVVPAGQAASLLDGLRAARLDAEETYWTQIAPGEVARQRTGVPFPVVLAERREMLLRSEGTRFWPRLPIASGRSARPDHRHGRAACEPGPRPGAGRPAWAPGQWSPAEGRQRLLDLRESDQHTAPAPGAQVRAGGAAPRGRLGPAGLGPVAARR
ncbi:hypothetical protein [Actinomadura roseirufa]|uniref:hypothetical protein n=1 Tax=Actinomadura roseirufa TaxID=2094049 RepID=UPI0010413E2A|nr:hypothetical protein [Actinomadura roseirufa]